jgi:DNA-binding transcriptional ArsR family regulator
MEYKGIEILMQHDYPENTPFKLMFILGNVMDEYGFVWDTFEELAYELKVSERTVRRGIKRLEEYGIITEYRSGVYKVNTDYIRKYSDE